MPTAITGLDDGGLGRPAAVVSALVEFGSALHVLRDPGHHGADGWAAGVRAEMSPRLAGWSTACPHSVKPGGWAETQYLAGLPVTAYAAPLRAASQAWLPPALLIGAGRDPLRDDARAYARRLDADGVAVTHVEYADTMHAFLNFCGALSAGPHAIELIAAALTQTLAALASA